MPEHHKKRKLKERLEDRFLITVRNEDTFEEKYRFKLSFFHLFTVLLGIFVTIGLLFMSILIITPLKRVIPGYGTIEDQTAFIDLKRHLKNLEDEVKVKNIYIESIQKMLTNDVESVEDAMTKGQPTKNNNKKIDKIKEDNLIREIFETKDKKRKNISNQSTSNAQFQPTTNYLIAPITGQISAGFEPSTDHFGIDITAAKNTPIKAILDGIIINSDWTIKTGHTIGIQHANNIISFYKHNSLLLKKVGESVKSGEAIAIIGNSGTLTDGPHLHFELWQNGRPVDPQSFIQFN